MNNNFNLKQFLTEGCLLNEIKVNKPDRMNRIKTLIQEEYPEIVEDGDIETGTEEWLFLLQLVYKVYGLNIEDAFDIIDDENIELNQQMEDLGYGPVSDLEQALEELGVEII
jgi:hypothetical protein